MSILHMSFTFTFRRLRFELTLPSLSRWNHKFLRSNHHLDRPIENNECYQDYWDFSHLHDRLLLDFPSNNHHVVQRLRSRQDIQESIHVDGPGDIVRSHQSCGETDLQSSQRSGILSQRWSVWSGRIFVIHTGPPIHSNGPQIEGNLSYFTDGVLNISLHIRPKRRLHCFMQNTIENKTYPWN